MSPFFLIQLGFIYLTKFTGLNAVCYSKVFAGQFPVCTVIETLTKEDHSMAFREIVMYHCDSDPDCFGFKLSPTVAQTLKYENCRDINNAINWDFWVKNNDCVNTKYPLVFDGGCVGSPLIKKMQDTSWDDIISSCDSNDDCLGFNYRESDKYGITKGPIATSIGHTCADQGSNSWVGWYGKTLEIDAIKFDYTLKGYGICAIDNDKDVGKKIPYDCQKKCNADYTCTAYDIRDCQKDDNTIKCDCYLYYADIEELVNVAPVLSNPYGCFKKKLIRKSLAVFSPTILERKDDYYDLNIKTCNEVGTGTSEYIVVYQAQAHFIHVFHPIHPNHKYSPIIALKYSEFEELYEELKNSYGLEADDAWDAQITIDDIDAGMLMVDAFTAFMANAEMAWDIWGTAKIMDAVCDTVDNIICDTEYADQQLIIKNNGADSLCLSTIYFRGDEFTDFCNDIAAISKVPCLYHAGKSQNGNCEQWSVLNEYKELWVSKSRNINGCDDVTLCWMKGERSKSELKVIDADCRNCKGLPVGYSCDIHEDCEGYGWGATDNACCKGKCTKKKKDYFGVGYCPHKCKSCAFCNEGSCATANTELIDIGEHLKNYNGYDYSKYNNNDQTRIIFFIGCLLVITLILSGYNCYYFFHKTDKNETIFL